MSTSLDLGRYNIQKNDSKHKSRILFTFYVEKGTVCNPVLVDRYESEIIFPSGTRYILFEHFVYENGLNHYFGTILN